MDLHRAPQDIDRYQQVFEHVRTVALTPQESIEPLSNAQIP